MCLITTQKEPKILTEDRIVYKLMKPFENGVISPYHYQEYKFGELYKTQMQLDDDTTNFDNVDGQAIDEFLEGTWRVDAVEEGKIIIIGAGFHSASTLERLLQTIEEGFVEQDIIVECTIPAGSEYFEGFTGLLVSNQIIINKIVYEQT